MTTTTDLAVRDGGTSQSGALAIYADQVEWTSVQQAALTQLGLRNASDGDRLVFLHQCQRTGLDPFARQIHMIERGGKWSIMTGIDGFRVSRARAERTAGVRGVLSRPLFYDADGNEHKVWVRPMPPVACEITYTVRDAAGETPYTSILRFTEYAQYKQDGKLTAKWSASPAHMLEKCTEADVYRKAFPQDFSGVQLDDSAQMPAEDENEGQPQRKRITADAIRQRHTVTAEVVTPQDASPADKTAPAAPQSPLRQQGDGPAGEVPERPPALIATGQKNALDKERQRLGYGDSEQDWDDWLADLAKLAGLDTPIAAPGELTQAEAKRALDQLKPLNDTAALRKLLDNGEAPDGA